jgi:hypothetical protein
MRMEERHDSVEGAIAIHNDKRRQRKVFTQRMEKIDKSFFAKNKEKAKSQ